MPLCVKQMKEKPRGEESLTLKEMLLITHIVQLFSFIITLLSIKRCTNADFLQPFGVNSLHKMSQIVTAPRAFSVGDYKLPESHYSNPCWVIPTVKGMNSTFQLFAFWSLPLSDNKAKIMDERGGGLTSLSLLSRRALVRPTSKNPPGCCGLEFKLTNWPSNKFCRSLHISFWYHCMLVERSLNTDFKLLTNYSYFYTRF